MTFLIPKIKAVLPYVHTNITGESPHSFNVKSAPATSYEMLCEFISVLRYCDTGLRASLSIAMTTTRIL